MNNALFITILVVFGYLTAGVLTAIAYDDHYYRPLRQYADISSVVPTVVDYAFLVILVIPFWPLVWIAHNKVTGRYVP